MNAAGRQIPFSIRPADRTKLLHGLDPITHTLTQTDQIEAFESARFKAFPWVKLN